MPEELEESIIVPIYKKGENRLYIIFVNYVQNVIQHPAVKVTSVLVNISVVFEATVQILIIYSTFVKYLR